MHEHVGKRAKMNKSEESQTDGTKQVRPRSKQVAQSKPNGWHKASKASISTSHGAEKGVYQAH